MVGVVKVESEEDLTAKQRAILEEALEHSEKSDAEIAADTDSSVSYVREVRDDLEDRVEIVEEKQNNPGGLILALLAIIAVAWWLMQNGML